MNGKKKKDKLYDIDFNMCTERTDFQNGDIISVK